MPGDPNKVKADPPAAVTVPVRGPEYVQLTARRVTVYRRGVAVLLGLGVLTAIEFAVAQASGSIVPMLSIGLLHAALIVQYFMNIYLVWSRVEAH